MTNKPIAFMPFSLPSPPSLCRRKAGEKEKKKQESARSMMGREKRSRAISIYIYIYFLAFLLGYPAEPLRRREESYGLEVRCLGCRKAPIVTNIV